MKNKLIIAVLMCVVIFSIPQLVAAQSDDEEETPRPPIVLKKLPELNESLPLKKSELKRAHFFQMTASGGMKPAYYAEFGGIKFKVAVRSKNVKTVNKISFISTEDENFKTGEGVMIGDTLEKILKLSTGEVIREPGWAFYVRLNSGWKAAFMQGAELTEGELSPDAKVVFLFKR